MIAKIFARPVAWLIAAAVLFGLLGLTMHSCSKARQAGAEASLATEVGKATAASGSDAVNSVGDAAARDAETDTITRENANAIQSAAGADAPINPAVHNAGLDSLCRRAAYRCTKQCLQRALAQGVADPGDRCTPARR